MKNETKMTPMMRQYLSIKKNHPEEILFFRMGDFYEMFLDDAKTASKILDIALTSRQDNIPMCGIPFHAMDSYIARLLKAGHRVAICEQMETAPSDGSIVKREVVRIITPGTVIESNLLQSDDNNFLASIVLNRKKIGLAFVDISTGDFILSCIEKSIDIFRGEIAKFNPREVIFHENGDENSLFKQYIENMAIPVNSINEWFYDLKYCMDIIKEIYNLANLEGLGVDSDIEITAIGSILQYLKDAHRKTFFHLKIPRRINSSYFMLLDDATIRNLELVQNQDKSKNRTLFSVLNHTNTAMGSRILERNILQPLLNSQEIANRLNIVQYFFDNIELTGRIQKKLKEIHDIERIVSRFTMGKFFPRDFIALMNSIKASDEIKDLLFKKTSDTINNLSDNIPGLEEIFKRILDTIDENPALSPEHGRVIKKGYNPELDRLYEIKKDARTWILEFQEKEKSRLEIPTLRVRYNKIHGYFIEVSKGQTAKVPDEYYRKQTLVNAERYTTETLQNFESEISGASDNIIRLENEEIEKLRNDILSYKNDLQKNANTIGEIDFYCSLANAAVENKYSKPDFNENGITRIEAGRHPVVEKYYTSEVFIPNDVMLDKSDNLIILITGPNMSGKSTYIRMTAIIQLMAQIGSFVPAKTADLSIADRIFTRIGASDNISRGESTFLVEMNETAVILNNATDKSLIIMDEIGRGTSTYDGLSIAWAVVEYILRYLKAKTLFATHYHELTRLGDQNGIANYNVLVKEYMGGVDFLHKVAPGAADKSYGIHVANLAGIPKEITANARDILEKLENTSLKTSGRTSKKILVKEEAMEQLNMFNASNHLVIQAIKNIDLNNITPMDAIKELDRLKGLIE